MAAGRVTVLGRHDQKAEAFTFGGALRLESTADRTAAVFESTAPILALLPENPFLSRLAGQAEALLARRQAEWDSQGKPDQFEARLSKADPRALYQACLHAAHQALLSGGVLGGASDKALEHLILAEGDPGQTAKLEDLV